MGVSPWDLLNLGIAKQLDVQYGTVSIAVSSCILLIDLLLRESVELGMILGVLIAGKAVDLCVWLDFVPMQNSVTDGLPLMLCVWLLGGPLGIGSTVCALCAGPAMQLFFRTFRFDAAAVRHQSLLRSLRVQRRTASVFQSACLSNIIPRFFLQTLFQVDSTPAAWYDETAIKPPSYQAFGKKKGESEACRKRGYTESTKSLYYLPAA